VTGLTIALFMGTEIFFDDLGLITVSCDFDMTSLAHRHPHHHHVANVSAGLCG
jgi:hypothetical protein